MLASCSRAYGFGRDILFLLPRSTASQMCLRPGASRRTHQTRCPTQATRTLATSARLYAKHKPASKKKSPPQPSNHQPKAHPTAAAKPTAQAAPPAVPAPAASPSAAALSLSVAEQLARRGEPTVLYEGPSHFWLRASGLSASVFCMGYVGVHYWSVVAHPPAGLPWWVPHAFVPILLAMGYFGGHFALSAAHIVRSITAVPRGLLPRSYLAGGKARRTRDEERALAALNASPVALEVSLSQLLPLLPPRRIIAAPGDVEMAFKMQDAPVAKGGGAQAPAAAPRGVGAGAGGVVGKLVAPFEALGRALKGPFGGVVRGLTREGFAKIKVKDHKYKIDVLGGKVLNGGKILDHLVAYRPDRI